MRIPQPGGTEVILPLPTHALGSGRGAKSRLRVSVVLNARSPRLLNFGLSLRTLELTPCPTLESKSATISPRTIFIPTFSMNDKSKFLSWVADP